MVGSVRFARAFFWGFVCFACGDPAGSPSEPSEASEPSPSSGGAGASAAPNATPGLGQAGSNPVASPGEAGSGPGSTPDGPPRPSNATRFLPACAEIAGPCTPEVVASDVTNPLLLRPRVDGLYFRSGDEIVHVAGDGTRTAVRTVPGLVYFEIQTDGTLYYSISTPGAVHRGQLDDPGADEVLSSDPTASLGYWGFTVTSTDLWQGTTESTLRIPKDGSAVSVVLGTSCVDLVSDDARVHCRAHDGIVTIDPTTEAAVFREEGAVLYSDIEVTSSHVYWVADDASSSVRELSRVESAPGSAIEVVSVPVQPNTFAPDDAGVYFTAREPVEGFAVYYLGDETSSAIPVALDETGTLWNGSTGIDATHVYWSMAPYELPEKGVIWRAPRCGCP